MLHSIDDHIQRRPRGDLSPRACNLQLLTQPLLKSRLHSGAPNGSQ